MPNIAILLKSEITRIARKEARAETQSVKKVTGQYRSEIAALKRRVLALEQQLGRVSRTERPPKADAVVDSEPAVQTRARALRFSAQGLAAQRQRMGLSVNQMGTLLGVSGQSVYKWEKQTAVPRQSHWPAISAVRAMGKKEAAARLAKASEQRSVRP